MNQIVSLSQLLTIQKELVEYCALYTGKEQWIHLSSKQPHYDKRSKQIVDTWKEDSASSSLWVIYDNGTYSIAAYSSASFCVKTASEPWHSVDINAWSNSDLLELINHCRVFLDSVER